MKPNKIKAARIEKGFTQEEMAEALNMKVPSYRNRESGKVPFSDSEKIRFKEKLGLSFEKFDDLFYDGMLSRYSMEVADF